MNLPVVYQKATKHDLQVIYELVSTRSRAAMGIESGAVELKVGDVADILLLASTVSTTEAITGGQRDRTVIKVRNGNPYDA